MRSAPGSIDTRDIVSICSANGVCDMALLQEILGHFIRDNQRRMDIATTAVQSHDRQGLRQVAHSVSGSAAMIGAGRLHDLAWSLEQDAASSEVSALHSAVAAMHDEFAHVLSALKAAHPLAHDA